MVSLRRRRLLGLCSGKEALPIDVPVPIENGGFIEDMKQTCKSFMGQKMPSVNLDLEKPASTCEKPLAFSVASASTSSKEESDHYVPVKQVKHRKHHKRRRHEDNQEQCMRGVYYKNMKWQAAIKVDKKQIHLGTVESQELAAHLYDRAAFMCGREPNFQLSKEEEEELRQYKWEDFLAMTRNAITNKKQQRFASGRRRRQQQQQKPAILPSPDSEQEIESSFGGQDNSYASEEGDFDADSSRRSSNR